MSRGVYTRKIPALIPGVVCGKWTVISEVPRAIRVGPIYFNCRCECGRDGVVRGAKLRGGESRQCQTCSAREVGLQRRKPFITGSVFGKWEILSITTPIYGSTRYLCRCVECGIVKPRFYHNVYKAQGCRCNSPRRKKNTSTRQIWQLYQRRAAFKKIEFSIELSIFQELISRPCHYCGAEKSNKHAPKKGGHEPLLYNGLDRRDSQLGYTPDNVVTCCSQCNYAKSDYTLEEFLTWSDRIYAHQHCTETLKAAA